MVVEVKEDKTSAPVSTPLDGGQGICTLHPQDPSLKEVGPPNFCLENWHQKAL